MTISALAKINATLEVTGIRPDGFHALRSIVVPIGLSDTLTFEPDASFSTDTGYENDLILKAARVLDEVQAGRGSRQPYRIHVEKRIPAGGGLGGGSADAAATLLALNQLWGLALPIETLASLGAVVGSDVPALVLANHYHQPVLMEGRGECVTLLPETATDLKHLVLFNPGIASSTPAVYAAFDRLCATSEGASGRNGLQPAAVMLYPEIGSAIEQLQAVGVTDVMMSGSGATVFGRVRSEAEGRKIVTSLQEKTRGAQIWYTTTILTGVIYGTKVE